MLTIATKKVQNMTLKTIDRTNGQMMILLIKAHLTKSKSYGILASNLKLFFWTGLYYIFNIRSMQWKHVFIGLQWTKFILRVWKLVLKFNDPWLAGPTPIWAYFKPIICLLTQQCNLKSHLNKTEHVQTSKPWSLNTSKFR